jgi:ATP-dependent DNA helicase DinG
MDILDCFPAGVTPRPLQRAALEECYKHFEAGKRFVILEGPPGIGKSLIAMALAKAMGGAHVVTMTKSLQSQYVQDPKFSGMGLLALKGRGAFACPGCGDSCREGGKIYRDAPCLSCAYRAAKAAALRAPVCVANYHMFNAAIAPTQKRRVAVEDDLGGYTYERVTDGLEEEQRMRPLTVLDEAHALESTLMDIISIDIYSDAMPGGVPPMPRVLDPVTCFTWLEKALPILAAASQDDAYVVKEQLKYEDLTFKVEHALRARAFSPWIVEPLPKDRFGFALKPLIVSSFAGRFFKRSPKVLLMSATIINPTALCRSLGIKPSEMAFVTLPCPFPIENRPIIVRPLDMSKAARATSWPKMIDHMVGDLDRHRQEKGLFLTPSNAMLEYAQQKLPLRCGNRLRIAFGDNREKVQKNHEEGPGPTVLAASGMWEGLDLADDKCRFSILPAMPRPQWAGQIKARAQIEPGWYEWRTRTRMVQGLGRGVRSMEDHAVAYVYDREFLVDCMSGALPDWLVAAVEMDGKRIAGRDVLI